MGAEGLMEIDPEALGAVVLSLAQRVTRLEDLLKALADQLRPRFTAYDEDDDEL